MDTLTSGYSVAFPVFVADELDGEVFKLTGEILGTAFALPDSFMVTAGHVAKEIGAAHPRVGVIGLAEPGDGHFKAARVRNIELLPCDIALLSVEFVVPKSSKWFHVISWNQTSLNPFDRVRSVGFPYGMHRVDEKLSSVQRAFEGHIVSRLHEFRPLGTQEPPFPAYELSFGVPRGLSGAPLLNFAGTLNIHGVVIGNSESKMLVFHAEERLAEPGKTTVVEQYETLRLGVAVTADHILNQQSSLLGTSVLAFVQAHGRVV